MAEATDSPVVSRLFTQGRHRNASVILLLQNMFPKGKYNTDISRNAQYLALFRSPSDRKQIGIIGERMFDKNRVHFMNAYCKATEKQGRIQTSANDAYVSVRELRIFEYQYEQTNC